jgi:hypothetical protein
MAGMISRALGRMGFTGERARARPMSEQGVSGYAVFGGYLTNPERRADLVGQQRYVKASDILANISIVAAGTRYFMNMLSKPSWTFDPADDSDAAKEMAEFAQEVIEDTATSWGRIVRRAGMYRYHGFGIQEWTAKKRDDGRIGLLDIEQRPQHTISQWDIDDAGNILGVTQTSPQTGARIYLPRQKFVYLVDDMMTDSPEGMGWFRHLVDPSERLTEYLRLEASGFQKDLSGIPVGRAPISEMMALIGTPKAGGGVWTEAEVKAQINGLRDFMKMDSKNNNSSILLDSRPYADTTNDGQKTTAVMKWGLELLQGKAESLEDIGPAIIRLTEDMARITGTENILTGSKGVGSNALSKDKSENSYLTMNAAVKDIAEAVNRDVIGILWDLNGFDEKIKPRAKVEDISFKDIDQITAAIRDMATAGAVLTPDDPVIDEVRDLMGLTHQPEMTAERMAIMMPPPPGPGKDPDNPETGAKK